MLTVKKTTELSRAEVEKINNLFNYVFKRNRNAQLFFDMFLNTFLGYSYHVLLYEGNELIGHHAGIPFIYNRDEEHFLVGLGLDSMTHPKHRDFFNVRDMFKACEEAMATDGCVLRIGFPNDNSYPILKKGFKYKDIGKLNTYFLPIKISGVKPNIKMLNPLSRLLSACIIGLSSFSRSKRVFSYKYGKDRSCFDDTRYKWFGGVDYCKIEVDGIKAYYKTQVQEGVKTLFILDVWPISKNGFDKIVRVIYKKEHKGIDMIIYVGHLPFTPMSLITMPHKFEPKHFNFTCKPLVKDYFDDSIYDINNWDVNLSNYDLL